MSKVLLCTGLEYATQLMGVCAMDWRGTRAGRTALPGNDCNDGTCTAEGLDDALIVAYTVRMDDRNRLSVRRSVAGCCDMMLGSNVRIEAVPLDDCCLSCTIKHDLQALLSSLPQDAMAPNIAVILPKGVQAAPTAEYLREMQLVHDAFQHDGPRIHVQSIVAMLDSSTAKARIFDDSPFMQCEGADLGDESDAAGSGDYDERCVGGALAEVIADANHVVLLPDVKSQGDVDELTGLVEALGSEGCRVHFDVERLTIDDLDAGTRADSPCARSEGSQDRSDEGVSERLDGDAAVPSDERHGMGKSPQTPLTAEIAWASLGQDSLGLSIRSHSPVHPSRLSDLLADKSVPMHIHGHFAVPNKPFSAFVWEGDPDGSIIETVDHAMVDESQYQTEILVVTRISEGSQSVAAQEFVDRFQNLLVTHEESQRPLMSWMEQSDTFTRWASMD
ncbi:MAG: hypothetical protein ABF489_05460 [Bifidobacterium sp.]|uniref:hypothetical protein n=1 Tax=Bifidobacterium sp. TaxID=41200 RepID=UPI0039EC90D0